MAGERHGHGMLCVNWPLELLNQGGWDELGMGHDLGRGEIQGFG
jgi:hypothetical protein